MYLYLKDSSDIRGSSNILFSVEGRRGRGSSRWVGIQNGRIIKSAKFYKGCAKLVGQILH